MNQYIYAFEDIVAMGVTKADSAEDAERAIKIRYENDNFIMQLIDPDGYEADGVQPRIF